MSDNVEPSFKKELISVLIVTLIAIVVFGGLFLTGFTNWKYEDHRVIQGTVVEKTVDPNLKGFTQQQCDFVWFGCKDVTTNYRFTLMTEGEKGYIVVSPETFDKYQLGAYYP